MVTNSGLKGLRVLITRPQDQAMGLTECITQQQGHALLFPVIEIEAIPSKLWPLPDLAGIDMLIFVSRNAVSYFFESIEQHIPNQICLAAVGNGTAQEIESYGYSVAVKPDDIAGSEGLLAMASLHDVAQKKVVIVRGHGGRELLADTLVQRGAEVRYVEVYQRTLPKMSVEACLEALSADVIICTSVAGVENLCRILSSHIDSLLLKPIIVVSERIKHIAEKLGFHRIMVTEDVSDEAMMKQLAQMEQ
jgi:uroporphyrinogen-III synthase